MYFMAKMIKQDFITFLQKLFEQECSQNSDYSLRTFANKLQISPATLSHLLKRKRKLTEPQKRKFIKALNISDDEMTSFFKNETSKTDDWIFAPDWIEHDEIDFDTLRILQLFLLKTFKSDITWIASKLNISVAKVIRQLEILKQLGVIILVEGERWYLRDENLKVTGKTSKAKDKLSLFKAQEVEMSLSVFKKGNADKKQVRTFVILPVNGKDLEKAKKITLQYIERMTTLFDLNQKDADQLYTLSVALYPTTED